METKASHSQHLCYILSRFSERYQRYGVSADDALLTGFLILLMVREVNSGAALPSSADELLNLVRAYLSQRQKLAETADSIYPLLNRSHGSMVELAYNCSDIQGTDQEYIETLDWVIDHLSVDAGLYATPREIAELMVKLAKVKDGNVLDPAAGTGGFFRACNAVAKAPVRFVGAELNPKAAFISQLYCELGCTDHLQMRRGSAFHTLADDVRYDYVLSNPPITRINRHEAVYAYADAMQPRRPSGEMSLNFIQLGLSKLKPGGRAAFLVNMGVLYSLGAAREVRAEWLDRGELTAVVALPGKLLPHTSNKCAILLFENSPRKNAIVNFVKADDLYSELKGGRAVLLDDVLNIILERLLQKETTPFSCQVSVDEIRSKDYSLHPDAYVLKEIHEVASRVAERWEKLSDIATIQQGTHNLGNLAKGDTPVICGKHLHEMCEGIFQFEMKDLAKLSGQPVRTAAYDVLLQRLGDKPAAYVVPPEMAGMVIDQTVFFLRFGKLIDPGQVHFIAEFFNSKRGASHIASFCRSTTVQTLTKTVLQEIDVPIADSALKELVLEASKAELALSRELIRAKSLKHQVFEGLGFEKLADSYDQVLFSVKTLENALEQKDKISYKVAHQYPFPIAYLYRNLYTDREWTAIYGRQMKFGEQLLSFLVGVGLSLLANCREKHSYSLSDIAEQIRGALSKGLSPGDWWSLLHSVCERLRQVNDCQLATEFSNAWYKGRGSKLSDFANLTKEAFIQKLNDSKHHRGPSTSDECKVAAKDHQILIDEALFSIEFISQWKFFICDDLKYNALSKKFLCSISLLMGDHPCFEQEILSLNDPLSSNHMYISSGGRMVSLSPFISVSYNSGTKRKEIFSLDKRDKKGGYILKSFDSGSSVSADDEIKETLNQWLESEG
ncbi:N-6 DNA methylase [Acidithiobacillus ferruginosus]|uniref:N-6 DNA methylase n=1 Tax=Acidithiobacillus ferruginosus TaxID=3063951 RepID=A0ACD5IMF2_9PROT|nr:N-6 DNA methylase [Acidithiobacillus ferruginosus]MBU2814658.1 N-6 DNA methylase [Acidithiobacillus ferruginosus]